MSKNKVFFISDHHLGQESILSYYNQHGTRLRNFDSLDQMHELMIEKHNSVVKPQDKVYFLGDVCIDINSLHTLEKMNGHKRLVRGNHDIFPTKEYLKYFDEIYGVRVFNGLPKQLLLIASHIPIHPGSNERFSLNIHGHLHSYDVDDHKFMNVSVEKVNYTPVDMDQIISDLLESM